MKTILKTTMAAGLALALTTFGAGQARAGGWAVAGGVMGGLAAGTVIGATVATAAAGPAYYSYPGPYAAPVYASPGPAVVVAPVRYGYYGPRPYVYGPYWGYHYPYARYGYGFGYGWGARGHRGRW